MQHDNRAQDKKGQWDDVQPVHIHSIDPASRVQANGIFANGRTYFASQAAYAGYATPTDMLSIRNPAASGKIVVPRIMSLYASSTAAALMKFFWYRRAALNTGGTPTDLAAVKYDTDDDAAVGVARVYGAAPVITDGAAPLINFLQGSTTVPASAPFNFNSSGLSFGWALNAMDFAKPLIVRPGQELAMNLAGAALPAGFTALAALSWMEFDIPA